MDTHEASKRIRTRTANGCHWCLETDSRKPQQRRMSPDKKGRTNENYFAMDGNKQNGEESSITTGTERSYGSERQSERVSHARFRFS